MERPKYIGKVAKGLAAVAVAGTVGYTAIETHNTANEIAGINKKVTEISQSMDILTSCKPGEYKVGEYIADAKIFDTYDYSSKDCDDARIRVNKARLGYK